MTYYKSIVSSSLGGAPKPMKKAGTQLIAVDLSERVCAGCSTCYNF